MKQMRPRYVGSPSPHLRRPIRPLPDADFLLKPVSSPDLKAAIANACAV
ncbi:hypothetical protein [Stieleria maiorica]|nr:hypothetical protein [Stieleria maiorica]